MAALAWLFYALFALIGSARPRKAVAVAGAGRMSFLLVAAETFISFNNWVYLVVRQPFTYHLLLLSDHLTGVRASLAEELNMSVLAGGAFSLMVLTAVAISLVRLAPSFLKQMSRAFHSRWGLVVTLIYLVAAHAWAVRELRDPTAAANPQLALVSSLFNFKGAATRLQTGFRPRTWTISFPEGRLSREYKRTRLSQLQPGASASAAQCVDGRYGVRGRAPTRTSYGAPSDDTPEMIRLAQHGLLFTAMYAPQGSTSEAMAALFSSLYPYLDWYLI